MKILKIEYMKDKNMKMKHIYHSRPISEDEASRYLNISTKSYGKMLLFLEAFKIECVLKRFEPP